MNECVAALTCAALAPLELSHIQAFAMPNPENCNRHCKRENCAKSSFGVKFQYTGKRTITGLPEKKPAYQRNLLNGNR